LELKTDDGPVYLINLPPRLWCGAQGGAAESPVYHRAGPGNSNTNTEGTPAIWPSGYLGNSPQGVPHGVGY